jgi:hypothetical protein
MMAYDSNVLSNIVIKNDKHEYNHSFFSMMYDKHYWKKKRICPYSYTANLVIDSILSFFFEKVISRFSFFSFFILTYVFYLKALSDLWYICFLSKWPSQLCVVCLSLSMHIHSFAGVTLKWSINMSEDVNE